MNDELESLQEEYRQLLEEHRYRLAQLRFLELLMQLDFANCLEDDETGKKYYGRKGARELSELIAARDTERFLVGAMGRVFGNDS